MLHEYAKSNFEVTYRPNTSKVLFFVETDNTGMPTTTRHTSAASAPGSHYTFLGCTQKSVVSFDHILGAPLAGRSGWANGLTLLNAKVCLR